MYKSIVLFGLAIAVNPVSLKAQTSALIAEQPLGARALALGESYVAVKGDPWSQYWNPAGIHGGRKLQLTFSHQPGILGNFLNLEYFAGSYALTSTSTLGVHFNYWDLGETFVTTETGPIPGKKIKVFNYVAGVTYAKQVAAGFSLGLTLKSIYQNRWPVAAQSWAADLGLLYSFGKIKSTASFNWYLDFGASLSNIGEDVSFIAGQSDPLPKILRLGLAYHFLSTSISSDTDEPVLALTAVGEYQNILNSDDNIWEWGAGIEAQVLGIAAMRGGYHERRPKVDGVIARNFDTGWTYGFGLKIPVHKIWTTSKPLYMNFDFASVPQNGFVRRYEMFTAAIVWGAVK